MICNVCRSTCTNTGPVSVHHETCSSFKRSIDTGCYFCTRLWAGIRLNERDVVLNLAEFESNRSSERAETSTNGNQTSSDSGDITLYSLEEGTAHGHPGCHVLQFSFNPYVLLSSEDITDTRTWRACFLLRPLVGKLKFLFSWLKLRKLVSYDSRRIVHGRKSLIWWNTLLQCKLSHS